MFIPLRPAVRVERDSQTSGHLQKLGDSLEQLFFPSPQTAKQNKLVHFSRKFFLSSLTFASEERT